MTSSFLTAEELRRVGFAAVDEDVLIDRTALWFGAERVKIGAHSTTEGTMDDGGVFGGEHLVACDPLFSADVGRQMAASADFGAIFERISPIVVMRGGCGNEKEIACEGSRSAYAAPIVSLDPPSSRRLVPWAFLRRSHPNIVRRVYQRINGEQPTDSVGIKDFEIPDDRYQALDLLAFRRPGTAF